MHLFYWKHCNLTGTRIGRPRLLTHRLHAIAKAVKKGFYEGALAPNGRFRIVLGQRLPRSHRNDLISSAQRMLLTVLLYLLILPAYKVQSRRYYILKIR
jgi:hypothetical protein